MNEFDVITFDCYGTLVDWERGIVNAFQSEVSRDGVRLDANAIIAAYMAEEPAVESEHFRPYRDVLRETAARVARRLGWTITPERADFLSSSLPSWPPFPETNPALTRLARRFRLGILSNVDDDLLAATRRHLTVTCDLIVTAQQVGSYKPGLAHFREAMARTQGARLLHAAQSYFHDVEPARSLNLPVAWINRKAERINEDAVAPTYEVRDLLALADLLGV
ncbi:MAG TPA: HAD family hydrolase [Methylomirabilota bacterium]|nr:HAD family hydrolase [Methylomirabilota bacterium]